MMRCNFPATTFAPAMTIWHDGDFSGDVTVEWEGRETSLPAELLCHWGGLERSIPITVGMADGLIATIRWERSTPDGRTVVSLTHVPVPVLVAATSHVTRAYDRYCLANDLSWPDA
jgi:hypothetical protein